MKTIPPTCPEPEFGRKYWRSTDQLADTPEFRQWMEREFPAGATEEMDGVSRRHFVKIMSASFMLAGVGLASSGCRRPVEKLEPFGKQPDNYVFGTSQYYATSMPSRGSAVPLVVRSYEGRPVKLEGNAQHPDSNGGTDRWTQASILGLYDPDRSRRFALGGNTATPESALDALSELSKKAQANAGAGLAFLLERSSSPSRARVQKLIAKKLPRARWYSYEAIDFDVHRRAASVAFGAPVKPYFKYDKAKVIVSLDCDFIGAEEDVHNNIRRFTEGRKIEKPEDSMNRLYAVEGLLSLTGSNADHRLRIPSSAIPQFAAALASEILAGVGITGLDGIGSPAGVDAKWITECAKDLLAHRGESLVVAGYRQPLVVHLIANALNSALGNVGKTVEFHAAPSTGDGSISDLAASLNNGQVDTLVVLGGNPAYNAPADLNWSAAQAKAKSVIRLGYYEDETFEATKRAGDWHLPQAHYLESWGDAVTSDGTLVPVQPLIAPLFGGLTELEVLARIGGESVTSPHDVVRATFVEYAKGDLETEWKKFLHNGYLANSAARPVSFSLDRAAVIKGIADAKISVAAKDKLEVILFADYSVEDGRYNNNGWLQEMPDPVAKHVWDNVVLISRKTAAELGVQNGDMVSVKVGNGTATGPIWVQPGQADNVLGIALGYGREKSGRVGHGVGFNAYPLFTSTGGYISVGATVTKTGSTYDIACTQDHWSMEGRPIIREANLEQFRKHPKFAETLDAEKPPVEAPMYPNPFDKAKEKAHHQWGMSVDLNSCVGCSSCMMACQSENNIPIVGKDLVKRGREMHWIRIDRYYAGDPKKNNFLNTYKDESQQQFAEWIDDPQVVTQPMLCQMCESAPCENVCPVNATSHSEEGLNLMTYNRCVGTRYCSNNCPYKVRRYNYLDFNKRSLKELKGPFYPNAITHSTEGKWDLLTWLKSPFEPETGMRQSDEWDLIKMSKNPDVTVRMRGVMEKCTFCIQRIEGAKIAQKAKAGPTGDVVVPTDSFTTACAQACPAGAIVFGNILDPNSRVSKLKQQERDYSLLDFLLTKPRLTYLAKVRNPNPLMPDYTESPLTLEEYNTKMGIEKPFEHEGEAHEAAAHHGEKGAH
ncbi:MAG: TAT-variant-translocated molybdopterin oxidoreductase [Verrucomicrobiota bacterium]